MQSSSRRQFLYLTAGMGSALALSAVSRWPSDSDRRSDGAPSRIAVSKTAWALGSDVSITALHTDRRKADAAIEAAFAELELVENLMSIYRPHSQLSHLNREGVLDNPHPYLVQVLQDAKAMARRTKGAFDVTVQPLWELYQQATSKGELPGQDQVAAARARIGWRHVEVARERVTLQNGAAITLNGIAQGFAADCAVRALRSHGVEHALIDTGELGALGQNDRQAAWTVGIQHPRLPDAYVSLAKLDGRFLATSGDYASAFTPDFRHHHLFDPRTGMSPQELASVTIAAPTATVADALSTAVFVLGATAGADLIRRTPGADALLVTKQGNVLATRGFPRESQPS